MDYLQLSGEADAKSNIALELDKLLKDCPDSERELIRREFEGFKNLFGRFIDTVHKSTSIKWELIKPPPENLVLEYDKLQQQSDEACRQVLNKLVVVKLNGGLGTSMGCLGPKSLISVRNDLTFLDLTIQQIEHLNKQYQCNIPLALMNSFNTEEDTLKVLKRYQKKNVSIQTFNQSRYPRINKESLLPTAKTAALNGKKLKTGKENGNPLEWWYPPGHGDFYESFFNSGLLDQYIKEGKEYVFISNIDNLGATIDLRILNHLINHNPQCEFMMEVTNKTPADIKGGTLIDYDGNCRLLEIAQVPKEHIDEFKSVNKFKIFNTNSLWIKLPAIKRVVENKELNMEIIANPKLLDDGTTIIQLETAAGAAMKNFFKSQGVNVPRSRFLPVKKTSDLLLVMSNLYEMVGEQKALVMSRRRQFQTTPLVKLVGDQFKSVKDFLKRIPAIPDMLELDHLTVSGDVTFGRDVTLKGTVIIIANHGDRIDIPAGSLLENKIVSGNLRILDH